MSNTLTQADRKNRLRRWLTRIVIVLGLLLTLLVLLVALLPTLLSTAAGTALVLGFVDDAISGSVKIDKLSLTWGSGQHAKSMRILDQQGDTIITVDTISALDLSLWSLLRGEKNFGRIRIVAPQVAIDKLQQNFQSSAAASDKPVSSERKSKTRKTATASTIDIRGKIEIIDAHFTYAHKNFQTVHVTIPNLTLDALNPQHLKLTLAADVRQQDKAGKITAEVLVNDLIDHDGRIRLDTFGGEIKTTVSDVPVALMALFESQTGLDEDALKRLIGPMIRVDLTAQGDLDAFNAALTVNSDQLNFDGRWIAKDAVFTTQPGAMLQWTITQSGWTALGGALPALAQSTLGHPVTINVELDALQISVKHNKPQWADASFSLQIKPTDIALDITDLGSININKIMLALESPSLKKQIHGVVSAQIKQAEYQGQVNVDAQVRNTFNTQQQFDTNGMSATVHANVHQLPTACIEQFAIKLKGLTQIALGPTVGINLVLKSDPQETIGRLTANYTVSIDTQQLKATIAGKLDSDQVKVASATAQATITPALVERIIQQYSESLPQDMRSLVLLEPSTINISDVTVAMKASDVAGVIAELEARVDRIVTGGVATLHGIQLQNIVAKIRRAKLAGPVAFTVGATVLRETDVGMLHVDGKITNPLEKTPVWNIKVVAEDLSTGLIEQVIGKPGKLSPLLAKIIDTASLTLANSAANTKRYSYTAIVKDGSRLDAKLLGYVDPNVQWTVHDQSFVKYRIDLSAFVSLLQQQVAPGPPGRGAGLDWKLTKPAQISLQVKQFHLPFRQVMAESTILDRIDAACTKLEVALTVHDIGLQRKTEALPLPMDRLSISIKALDLRKPIEIIAESPPLVADTKNDSTHPPPKVVDSKSTITALFNAAGQYDPARVKITTDTMLSGIPVDLIDQLAMLEGKLVAILGPSANISIQGGIDPANVSRIDIVANAASARCKIAGTIGRDLVLHEDGDLELEVTEQLSELVLTKINPIINAVHAERPIKVTIYAKTFKAPLRDYDFSKITGDFEVDLGTLTLDRSKKRGGQVLGILVDFLGEFAKLDRSKGSGRHTAVFTPMKIHLENGVVSYKDMTMTLDGIVLNFHGRINIPRDRVNLVLGLSGKTFANNPQIARYIDPDDQFDIPMKGSTGKVKLDTDKFVESLGGLGIRAGIREVIPKEYYPILEGIFGPKKKQKQRPKDGPIRKDKDDANSADDSTKNKT